MSEEAEVLVPPQLEEMVAKLFLPLDVPEQHERRIAYDHGWIKGCASTEYAKLVQRDGIPSNPHVVKLLCELAIMRALVRWHEIRSQPPPMPSIRSLS